MIFLSHRLVSASLSYDFYKSKWLHNILEYFIIDDFQKLKYNELINNIFIKNYILRQGHYK